VDDKHLSTTNASKRHWNYAAHVDKKKVAILAINATAFLTEKQRTRTWK
jgi:hypothetical protein